jgi:hypothetical protein
MVSNEKQFALIRECLTHVYYTAKERLWTDLCAQVLTLDLGPDGVRAKVQGSQVKPYKVSISFRCLAAGDG